MHTFKAIQQPSKEYVLEKDGIPAMCPKLMYPMMGEVRSALGQTSVQTQLMRLPCSTVCPFAEVGQRNEIKKTDTNSEVIGDIQNTYTISCEGGCKTIVLNEVVLFEKKEPAALLKV